MIPYVDYDRERYEQAAADYVESDEFTDDALSWVSTHGWQHAELVELAMDHYRQSDAFATVVQDALDGEVRWR